MKFIIGKKLEMAQQFTQNGVVVPVTLVSVEPCVITQVRTMKCDGYTAVQIGTGVIRHAKKPQLHHLKDLNTGKVLREFRVEKIDAFTRGQMITAAVFAVGDAIEVEGVSKGHGFQGVVKRHGFHGHPKSHGHKDQLRMPGSIGSKRQGPVAPGKRMAGRMGSDQVTVKNLSIISIDLEKGIIAVKGALPGARNGLLLLSGPGEMNLEKPTQEAIEQVAALTPEEISVASEVIPEAATVTDAPAA